MKSSRAKSKANCKLANARNVKTQREDLMERGRRALADYSKLLMRRAEEAKKRKYLYNCFVERAHESLDDIEGYIVTGVGQMRAMLDLEKRWWATPKI
jgi:hypothetical protein